MTDKEIVKVETPLSSEIMESLLIGGDLSKLNPQQRVQYYLKVCSVTGVNPTTKPFLYIQLNGKLVLYASKDCADQLRKNNGVSVTKLEHEFRDDVYIVTAQGQDKTGRTDSSIGAVNVKGLGGDALANALMKAETKAKRRLTLSICGMGMLDETEVETIAESRVVEVDMNSGEIKEAMAIKQSAEMTLDTAKATVSSDGTKYGDIPTDKLSIMANSLKKKLDKNDEPDQREIRKFKLDAIICILKSRVNENPA
jgi:hypothetical protein